MYFIVIIHNCRGVWEIVEVEFIFYLFIFTFILTKLEFGFYESHINGLFTPVKNTFPNKYNWINTNNESSHWKVFPRKVAAPRSAQVKRVIFYKYLQNLWKSHETQPRRRATHRSDYFCNNEIVKSDLY